MRALFSAVSNPRLAVVRSVFLPPREHGPFFLWDTRILDLVVRLGPEQTRKRDHAEGVHVPLLSLSGARTGRLLQQEKPDAPLQGCNGPRVCVHRRVCRRLTLFFRHLRLVVGCLLLRDAQRGVGWPQHPPRELWLRELEQLRRPHLLPIKRLPGHQWGQSWRDRLLSCGRLDAVG